jgi:hypothetical protein
MTLTTTTYISCGHFDKTPTIPKHRRGNYRRYLYKEHSEGILSRRKYAFWVEVYYRLKSNDFLLWNQITHKPKASIFRPHWRYGHKPFLKYKDGFV